MKNYRYKRGAALTMAAVMTWGSVVTASANGGMVDTPSESLSLSSSVTGKKISEENYIINNNSLMTRLRMHWDEAELNLAFVRWMEDASKEERFTAAMGESLLENGKIQINDGEEWSFAEAGLEFANSGTKSSYLTHKKEFIKEFYEQESFTITVTTPEGYVLTLENVTNEMTEAEKKQFKASLGETDSTVQPSFEEKQEDEIDSPAVESGTHVESETSEEHSGEPEAGKLDEPVAKEETQTLGEVSSVQEKQYPKENYIINDNSLMTRLRMHWDEAELNLAFVRWMEEDTASKEERFTVPMAEGLLKAGSIQINDGKKWSFRDAGLDFAPGGTKTSYLTHKKEFIKEFYEQESFTITVTTPEGYVLNLKNVKNEMTKEEKEQFKASLGEEEPAPQSPPVSQSRYQVKSSSFLNESYGTLEMRIEIEGFKGPQDSKMVAFWERAQVKINGHDLGTLKELGFEMSPYFGYELKNEKLASLASVIKDNELKIEFKETEGSTFCTLENKLTEEQRNEIAKHANPEDHSEIKAVTISSCKAELVKATDPSVKSMSGDTMEQEAEMIVDHEKGETTLILHFKPAVIMDILAFTTDLKLDDGTTEFVMSEDNTAVCIVKIPAFEDAEKVFSGHIYSSVMDADVALKVQKSEKITNLTDVLTEKVTEVEKLLTTKKFYKQTVEPVQNALNTAKNPENPIQAYIDLLKAVAGLREIVDNPFVGDSVFHVKAQDSAIISRKSLGKYVKVEVKGGKSVLTAHYNSYLDWDGFIYIDSVRVLNENGQEIPSRYSLDDEKNGTLTFELPYIPASGIFELELGDGRKNDNDPRKKFNSQLIMDYSTVTKGPFKQLLRDAVDQYGYYTYNDYSGRGEMTDRKDDFTPSTWSRFEKALTQCKHDLESGSLTQEQIEDHALELKNARKGLVYKIKAGQGSTASTGIAALNNPSQPYYPNDSAQEYPELVGWAGSKVVFGKDGAVYRVLDKDRNQNGSMLLMAEDLRVKHPFADQGRDDTRWEDSLLRKHMNGRFFDEAYSALEKTAIMEKQLETYDYIDASTIGYPVKDFGGKVVRTKDRIFAPSIDMLTNESYGYGSNDSRTTDSTYALRNVVKNVFEDYILSGISSKGRVGGQFMLSSDETETVPCLYLDASKVLMTIDANTGLPNEMTAVRELDSNLWKLVLQDDFLRLNGRYQAKANGSTISVDLGNYYGDVLAVVVEGNNFATGKVKSYGKVNANGFRLPDFDQTKEKLYLMAIREDGKGSIAASNPAEVSVEGYIAGSEEEAVKPVANKGMIAITMNMDGKEKPSMCNPLFAAKGDVEIHGDMAALKLYVAYPIPKFASDGKDGTLKNVSITYQGKQYEAESDITTKPLMVARESNNTFGLTAGQELPAQILTFKLPKAALEEKKLDIKAYVNVFMNSDQDFDMCLSDLQLTEITKPAKPIVAVEAEITNKTEDGISASIKNVNIQTGDREAGKVSVTAMTSDANAGTVKKSTITLPKENAKKLSRNNVALEVQTNQATVTLDKHVVDIIAEKDKDVILSVEKHPNVQGGYTDAYSLELMADNEKVDFSGGNVVVTVKSELSNGWAHHIVDNKPASSYKLTKNPDGTVSWKTNHFSDWALSADNKAPNAQPEMNGSSGSHSTSGNNSSTSDNNNSASDKESRQDIVDGNYYVDVTLIKSNKNEKSMGDVAFEKNRQALVTFRNGKVDKVQMSSNPVQMGTYFTAITDIKVDGRSVKALKTKAFTTQPEGNNYNYLSEFSFDLPSNAMPEKLRGETMVPVSFKVPDTPMGNDYMEARLRFDWGAAVKTKDQDIAGNAEGVSKAQEVYLKDTATGIELLGNTENLSSKAKFNVSVLTSGKDYELAKKAMESVNKSWKLYRLTAVADGKEVSLNGSVQLSIPCGGKEIEVYRISDNGRKIAVKGKVVKNNYVVNTSALGLFAVTEGQGMSQAPAKASSFTDVPAGFWAKDAIELVVSRGLFRGDTATTFQPNGSMSRAMFVTVLGRLANVDNQAVASSKFSDVPASAYYAPYVEWAAKNGIVNGTTATTFTPDQPVTRQEMAVFLTRYAERFSIQLKNEKSVAFADEADIAGFAKEAVRTMAAAGLLNGVGENKFAPNDRSSRAEVAALLARFIKEYSL